ncbi:MBG domain-containing protein [Propionispora hippei]|uniref:Filamentous hemagglutinin family N-terminal domain-containing protein n=1 Tax=Propionispora hippei DSM 15287 TaxID=1123003 RepID=A0A1M6F1B4_9FIRM|nr:MBG domain-containing protein [Propionispora hippei]SHI91446.1 filamentous hemagglutinin family N-terminal domain-containing protein [Propionispora hippei DSM 15287]
MRISRKQRRARQRRQETQGSLKSILKKSAQAATVAAFLLHGAVLPPAQAMPANGQVSTGAAVINQAGSVMTIQQQTAQAAINWQSFGIAANEAVRFLQPGANSAILNRVIGNNPSAIFGQLTSNGRVFLVNQNGVYFAPGSQVNVGGLVATTLSITDADFMAGRYAFASQGQAGSVINQGSIIAGNQGLVALLAPEVKNEGVIVARKGSVVLAAGNQATLDFNGDGKVQLALGEGALKAVADNQGLIEADGGLVLMTARAGQDLTSSVVNQSGVIRARSLDGQAGAVTLNAVNGTVQAAGTVDASAAQGQGGTVNVFGKDIVVTGQVDVSGSTGGKVRIGGDWQGSGDAPHADQVTIAREAVINADARNSGQGGTVAIWSDGTTKFDGTVSARGGAQGGDGGKVETSGHVLQANGTVNAAAVNGKSGEWLLDPYNLTIASGAGGSAGSGSYVPGANDSTVDVSTINNALNGGTDVTIKTGTVPGMGSAGSQNGDITVNSDILKSSGGNAKLTLQAHNDIIVNANIGSTAGQLNLDFNADTDATAGGAIRLNSGKAITTNGGSVLLHGGAGTTGYAVNQANSATPGVDIQGSITTSGGTITMYGQSTAAAANAAGVSLTGALDSGGGNISINGWINNTAADSSSAGVKLGGTMNAGTGTVTVSGQNDKSGGNGMAVVLGSSANMTAKNTVLIGNAMTFDGAARVTGAAGGTLTVKPLTAGRNVFVGTTGSNGLNLVGNLFNQNNNSVFQGFGNTVIGHDAGTGTITVNGAAFGNDVTLQATGTNGNIAVNGALAAGSNTITLKAAADSGGTGVITASGLNLQGTNAAFTLGGANAVTALAGNVKSLAFTNGGSFTVDAAGGASGLTIAGSSILTANTGGVTVNKNITSSSGTNTLTVNANDPVGGTITVNAGATVGASAGKLNVTFNAGKDISLNGGTINTNGGNAALTAQGAIALANAAKVQAADGNINLRSATWGTMNGTVSGAGKLTIDTYAANGTIGVGDGSAGALRISTAAFGTTPVFTPGFSEIVIGRTDGTGEVNVGKLTVQDKLTVQSGDAAAGKVTFAAGADLETNNKALTIDAGTIDFTNGATVEAGSGDLTLNADTITNWSNAKFDKMLGGQLAIAPKTAARALQIGGTAAAGKLSVDAAGMTKIGAGQFSNVTIGRSDGTGAVSVDSFAVPSTTLTVLSPGGAAAINSGANITGTTGQTLTFKVQSLTQDASSKVAVDKLLLDGNNSGAFDLSAAANAVGTVAAKVGSLKLYNGSLLTIGTVGGVNGITATGKVELAADRMTVNQKVTTPGDLQIYTLTNSKNIQVGGTDNSSDLYLPSSYFNSGGVLGGSYNKIILGRLVSKGDKIAGDHNGNISIADTSFSAALDIRTTANAALSGTVKVGSASPYKDLSLTANQATLPGGSNLYVKNLNLELASGLNGLAGQINGTGSLTVKVPDNKDIYISDTYNGDQYKIPYTVINNVFTGFPAFAVSGKQNVYFDAGNIGKSVSVASGTGVYGVTVQGNVGISGSNTHVGINGGFFSMNSGTGLTVSGNNAAVNISADNDVTLADAAGSAGATQLLVNGNDAVINLTAGGKVKLGDYARAAISGSNANVTVKASELALGANAQINLGSGDTSTLTLQANKLTETVDSITNITGQGTLNLGPRDGAVALDVNTTGSGSGLVITQTQLNGGLFDNTFKNLNLGRSDGTGPVTIDGVSVNNTITVQNGPAGTINIGSGGLTVSGSNKVTLKANKISNSSGTGVIDAGTGTINLYANDLSSLTGTKTVKGSGTLGLATYDGSKVISLGSVQHGTGGLWLTNNLLTTTFDTSFDHYNIGNTNQGNIYVNSFDLGGAKQDTTLTAQNIVFEGDANLDGKTLALNAGNSSSQTNGVITADKLALQGGTYDLSASVNKIGLLAANARQVKVKAEKLVIGQIATRANGTVTGVAASGTGVVNDDTIRLEATTPGGLAVNQNVSAAGGDITLTADTMTFDPASRVSAPGMLTVQQYNPGTTLDIGTPGTGTLQLGSSLFNGTNRVFKDGFSHLYLGRDDGTGAVTVAGSLDFADPTTIRSPGTGGSITVKNGSTITTGNNSLEFKTVTLTTEDTATVNTGSGDLTLTVDNLNLAGNSDQSQAPIQGTGQLIFQTLTQNRDLYLGQSGGSGLYLKAGYFDGTNTNRVFRDGYSKIILGRPDGTGALYQTGTTAFTDEVLIRQASANSTGSVNVKGIISTDGNNFSVESQKVNIDAQINAGDGDVSLTADALTITDTSSVASTGKLLIQTYSPNTNINLGSGGGVNDLNLKSSWFNGGQRIFKDGFESITIGRTDGTGAITVNDNFKVTDHLTLQNGSGPIRVADGKALDLGGNNLTVTTNTGAITIPGIVQNVNTLTATSLGNRISFNNQGNTITRLGNITAGKGVEIRTSGGLTIDGTVNGNTSGADGEAVAVWTKDGNLVLGGGGKVTSQGNAPVYLVAENSHFINQNKSANSRDMIDPGNSRWIISTDDSIGDVYGGLTGDFRRYGTDYSEITSLPGTYVGNGAVHKNQPVATIYGKKVYGDGNAQFFGNTFSLSIADWAQRQALDQAFLGGMTSDQTNSAKYNFGTGINAAADVNLGGTAYGTNRGAGDALYAAYTGANPLNYKVETEFWVAPKNVTVTANTATKVYDGQKYISGANGVTYSGFVNGQTAATAGISDGAVSYGGSADGAKNVGSYAIDIDGNLQANNYTFTYVDGMLTVTPAPLTIKANNDSKVYDGRGYNSNNGVTYSGFVNGETNAVLSGTLGYSGTSQPAVNVGNGYVITPGGLTSGNYTITYQNGALNITPKEVLVTANNATKVYDGLSYAGGTNGVSYSGFADGQDETTAGISGGAVTYGGSANGAKNVGNYAIDIDGNLQANNYTFAYVDGTLTVTPAPLTIKANNDSKVYDGLAYYGNKGVTYSGFVNGETAASLGGTLSYGGSSQSAVNAGGYAITPGGLTAGNYMINFVDGTLNITPAPLTITANNDSKMYDGRAYDSNKGVTYSGFVNGETTAGLGGTLSYGGSSQSAVNVGDAYEITPGGLTSSNYDIHYVNGKLEITRRPITITVDDASRYYGYDNPTRLGGKVTGDFGLVTGDSLGTVDVAVSPTATPTAKAGTTHSLEGTGVNFTAGQSGNYEITYVDGMLTILKAPLTITADNQQRPQGTDNSELTVAYAGLKNGEKASDVVTGLTVGTQADKSSLPGGYDIIPNGAIAENYQITFVNGQLTVIPNHAAQDAQTVTQPKTSPGQPSVPGQTVNPPGSPVTLLDPAVPPVNTVTGSGLPSGLTGQVSITTGGPASERTFVADNGGFGLRLNGVPEGERGPAATSRTSGAVPVLYAGSGEQRLDGIYTINYNPNELSILPAAQKVTIPRLDEIASDVNKTFGLIYRTKSTGSFEVTFGNGIVSIHPLDETALGTVTGKNREPGRAILAAGILSAVEDLGVTPDQVRAVYLFTEIKTRS